MHKIQQNIMKLSRTKELHQLSLRDIGELLGLGREKPQLVKHHLQQLVKRGLLVNKSGKYFPVSIEKENRRSSLVSLPIYGLANCGQALSITDDQVQGYLKVSPSILRNRKNVFVVIAKGDSMNRAKIGVDNISDGDYVLIDSEKKNPEDGDYVLSIIDGAANIKRFKKDLSRQMIMLLSESSSNYDPIYIHFDDLSSYSVAGQVIGVLKS